MIWLPKDYLLQDRIYKCLMNLQLMFIMWDNICSTCGAFMFKDEKHIGKLTQSDTVTFSGCCGNGNFKLPPIKNPPALLKELLTGNTPRDKKFCDNIRAYNSSLAFSSLCLTGQEFKFKNPGPYCYRINGQLYHAINLNKINHLHSHRSTYMIRNMSWTIT